MIKKIILITSVALLSSCADTTIRDVGDKFLNLINPSDPVVEVADLGESEIILESDYVIFSEEDLALLSDEELIQVAKQQGIEYMIILDSDGNLANREEIVSALTQSGTLAGLSDEELIQVAKQQGIESMIILDSDGNLANREEIVSALTQSETAARLSDEELIQVAKQQGIESMVILDSDGNLANREEIVSALTQSETAAETLEDDGVSFILYFSYDDTEIDEKATQIIIEHANFMMNNPKLFLRLEGHADERGTREYNLALGENRSLSVKEVLGLYGLENRIEVVSFGEEQPVAFTHDEEGWQKNRRVEFKYQK